MRKLLLLNLWFISMFCICCSEGDKEPAFLEITSSKSLVYENTGGRDTIFLNTNKEWDIMGTTDWCSVVSVSKTAPQYAIIEVASVTDKKDRSLSLTFVCGDKSASVSINQFGSAETGFVDLKLESSDAKVDYNEYTGLLTVNYTKSTPSSVRKGQAIVLPYKYGYEIRVIENVKINGNTLVAQTSKGHMGNLFKNTEFTLATDRALGEGNVILPTEVGYVSLEGNYNVLYSSKDNGRSVPEFFSYQKSYNDTELYKQGENDIRWKECMIKAKLHGSFYFKFGEKEDNNGPKGDLEKFSMRFNGDLINDYLLSYDIKQSINHDVDKAVQKDFVQSYVFRFVVNSTPVVIVTHADLNKIVKLQGSSSSATVGFKDSGVLDLKTEWEKGREVVNTYTYTPSLEVDDSKRQVSGAIAGNVSYYPSFEFDLYHTPAVWIKPQVLLQENVVSTSKNYDKTYYAWEAETKSVVNLSIGGSFDFANNNEVWNLASQEINKSILLHGPSKIELVSPADSVEITRNKNVEAKFKVTSYCPVTNTYSPCAGVLVYFEAVNGLSSQVAISDDNGMAIVSWKPTTTESSAQLKAGIVGESDTYVDEDVLTVIFKGTSRVGEEVDLGLPSGTKWASWNLGANAPEEYGDCYAWADLEERSSYTWSSYIYAKDTDNDGEILNHEIENIGNIYGTEKDIAHVMWGDGWRLPTAEELDELRTKCSWEWTTQNGVSGRKVTGPNGNSIFLPAAGFRDEGGLRKETAQGYYWTGSLDTALNVYHRAYRLYFCQSYVRTETTERYIGGSIRPVKK